MGRLFYVHSAVREAAKGMFGYRFLHYQSFNLFQIQLRKGWQGSALFQVESFLIIV